MTMQTNNLSRLFSFDTTKNSKLNLMRIALSFNNHEDSPVAFPSVAKSNESNRLRVVLSCSPSLANEREARVRARPLFYRARKLPGKFTGASRNATSGPIKFPDKGPDKLSDPEVTGTFEKRAPGPA